MNTLRTKQFEHEKGFMAFSTILILSAVILSIVTTVSFASIGELQSSFALFKGEDNLHFVEGCVEDYLLKIRANENFAGGEITRPEGNCTINIQSPNPNWDIIVSSQSTQYQRSIQVKFIRTGSGITLSSWKEI